MQGVARSQEEKDELKLKILEYLSGGYGRTLYGACQSAPIAVSEVYKWRDEDGAFDKAIGEARKLGSENAKDVAESAVMKMLTDPNNKEHGKTVRWFMDRKAGDRGYNPKQTIDVNSNNVPDPDTVKTPEELVQAMAELRRMS